MHSSDAALADASADAAGAGVGTAAIATMSAAASGAWKVKRCREVLPTPQTYPFGGGDSPVVRPIPRLWPNQPAAAGANLGLLGGHLSHLGATLGSDPRK
jgi:hypothetical protein